MKKIVNLGSSWLFGIYTLRQQLDICFGGKNEKYVDGGFRIVKLSKK